MAVTAACLLISGCYTQVRTDVVKVDPVREQPQTHIDMDDLTVTTERPWYEKPQAGLDVLVKARFENHGYRRVILSGCPHPPAVVVEEWDGATWQDGVTLGIYCKEIHSKQVMEFEPGDWLDFDFHLGYPGWYRIRLLVGPDAEHPTAFVHSNQFLIK
jgi:hypothetical protein